MLTQIQTGHYEGVSSVLLVRNGFLVLDEYLDGAKRESLHSTRSAAKAITSALVGIAIDKGYVESVDAPLLPFFPEYLDQIKNWDDRKDDITIAHVLSMSSGIRGNEDAMYQPTTGLSSILISLSSPNRATRFLTQQAEL